MNNRYFFIYLSIYLFMVYLMCQWLSLWSIKW